MEGGITSSNRMQDDRNIQSLWESYRRKGDSKAFYGLMNHYMPIVISTAKRIKRRTRLDNLGELVEMGIRGLRNAIETYRNIPTPDFAKYARREVRRKVIEAIRKSGTPAS